MPIKNVKFGKNVKIPYPKLVNLYGCKIGKNCFIGPFVEIQKGVTIGDNTRIQSHAFICSKTRIGKDVFIGHGVIFVNDKYPIHRNPKDWGEIIVDDKVTIGSNATVLPCKIRRGVLVGAGAVITKDVSPNRIVAGNPARIIRERTSLAR